MALKTQGDPSENQIYRALRTFGGTHDDVSQAISLTIIFKRYFDLRDELVRLREHLQRKNLSLKVKFIAINHKGDQKKPVYEMPEHGAIFSILEDLESRVATLGMALDELLHAIALNQKFRANNLRPEQVQFVYDKDKETIIGFTDDTGLYHCFVMPVFPSIRVLLDRLKQQDLAVFRLEA